MANHTNFYDRVVDDVVDISWGLSVFNPGKFANSLALTIPFFIESSEQGGLVACRMYEAGAFGEDYKGLKPLLFGQFPQASLHTADTPIESLQSMKGLSIIATSPPSVEITKGNEGTPVSVAITEVYEAIQRGTADGFINSFTAISAFKLGDVLKHHYVTRMGGALGVVFMTEENYNSLPPQAQAAIDANSTCEASRELGAFIDNWNSSAMQVLVDDPEHTVTYMSDEEISGLLDYVGDEILTSFEGAFPGGKPLIDAMMAEIEATK